MMSFPSNSPSPANLLADKSWRRRHSAWLLAPILGCGMLSFVGFLYVAVRVQSKKFWIAATISCVGSAVPWIVLSLSGDLESTGTADKAAASTESMSDLGASVVIACWAALLVYGFVLNRDYLRWRAGMSESNAWYNQSSGSAANVQNAGYTEPQTGNSSQAPGFLGVDPSDYFASPSQPDAPKAAAAHQTPAPATQNPAQQASRPSQQQVPQGPVDVNSASAVVLAASLGIDPTLATRVVAVRDGRGGFATLDDMVSAAGLQPHELLKFQGRVTFGHGQRSAHQTPAPHRDRPSGRIVDI